MRMTARVTPSQIAGSFQPDSRNDLGSPLTVEHALVPGHRPSCAHPPPEEVPMKRLSLMAVAALLIAGAQAHAQGGTKADTSKKAAKTAQSAAKTADKAAASAKSDAKSAAASAKTATKAAAKADSAAGTAKKKSSGKKKAAAKKDTTAKKP